MIGRESAGVKVITLSGIVVKVMDGQYHSSRARPCAEIHGGCSIVTVLAAVPVPQD